MKHFHIRETDEAVELWSGYRIQFDGQERHEWQKTAKAELKAALAKMVPAPGSAFSGYYDSTDPTPTDAENSLFTNLRETMPKGVRLLSFEQGSSGPPTPPTAIHLINNHLHYYRYQPTCQWASWETDQILARWNRVPRTLAGDDSARPVWYAMRRAKVAGLVELTGKRLAPGSDFGVRLIIHAPRWGLRELITNSESIVDGTIAAFHNDSVSESLIEALTQKFPTIPKEDLRNALDSSIALFDTPAITCSKSGFLQMSPADEQCRVGELLLCNDSTSRWPELSGELFTIRPAKTH